MPETTVHRLTVEVPPDLAAYVAAQASHYAISKACYVRMVLVKDRDQQPQRAAA